MVILVGMYFILTAIYNEYGVVREVHWSIYIKTVREVFVLVLLLKACAVLPNVLSILSDIGGMAYSLGLIAFRLWAACMSDWIYEDYFAYMKNGDVRNYFTLGMFVIMATVHFIAYPQPIIKYIIIPIKKLSPWKFGS